jgi:hypothetical protein
VIAICAWRRIRICGINPLPLPRCFLNWRN